MRVLLHIFIGVHVCIFVRAIIQSETTPYPSIPSLLNDIASDSNHFIVGIDNTPPKQLADISMFRDPTGSQITGGSSNCTIDDFILGFGFEDNLALAGKYAIPPDPIGATGYNRLVAVVNSMIEVRGKNGTLIFRDDLNGFFSLVNSTILFDPKVIYDEYEGRFVVIALQRIISTNVSSIFLAVSKDENPDDASRWNRFQINSTLIVNNRTSWVDYPGFEVDEKAIYITCNMFEFNSNAYTGGRVWIVPKGLVDGFYGGGRASYLGPYDHGIQSTVAPAQVHGVGGLGPLLGSYLVAFKLGSNTSSSFVKIVTIKNPLVAPIFEATIVDLGKIAHYTFLLPDAPQLGTTTLINAGDVRALDAVWRNKKLWLIVAINPSTPNEDEGQTTAHWMRIDTTGGNFTLDAQGNIGGETFSNKTSTYYPSIAVNKDGVAAVGYSASSPTMFAGAYGSLLIGLNELPFIVKEGIDYYVREGGGSRNRWGDYTGVSVDPVDNSFWFFNQFADVRGSIDSLNQDGRWGTAWAHVACTLVTMSPTRAPTKSPTTKAPTKSPTTSSTLTPKAPPTKPPTRAPSSTPMKEPTDAPSQCDKCGLFGLGIFCIFSGCGFFRRLIGFCDC